MNKTDYVVLIMLTIIFTTASVLLTILAVYMIHTAQIVPAAAFSVWAFLSGACVHDLLGVISDPLE